MTTLDGVPIVDLTGPMLLGLCMNWGLFGCATVQTYNYYIFFPNDRRTLKFLIYSLYLWDVAQTILYTQAWFQIFGPGFGSDAALETIGTSWFSVPFMSGVSSATVQSFYAWRVLQLSNSRVLAIFIVLLALMEGSAGIALGFIMGFDLPSFAELQTKTFAVTSVWLLGSAVCDVIICLSMLYFLRQAKNRTSISRTENMLTRIIRLSIGAGLVTATIATIDGCLYLVFAHNNFHMAPAAILGKLYTNSFLVLCNSRQRLRSMDGRITDYLWEGSTTGQEKALNGRRSSVSGLSSTMRSRGPTAVAVEVSVESDVQMVSFDHGKGNEFKFGQDSA